MDGWLLLRHDRVLSAGLVGRCGTWDNRSAAALADP